MNSLLIQNEILRLADNHYRTGIRQNGIPAKDNQSRDQLKIFVKKFMNDLEDEFHLLKSLETLIEQHANELLWDSCDCGCPDQRSPKSKFAVEVIRIQRQLEGLRKNEA